VLVDAGTGRSGETAPRPIQRPVLRPVQRPVAVKRLSSIDLRRDFSQSSSNSKRLK
jgi:hypothetical protein